MKLKLVATVVFSVLVASVASAQTGTDVIAQLWRAVAYLQLEIQYLASQLTQARSPHLFDANGTDLGAVIDTGWSISPPARSFRVFDQQRQVFLSMTDFGTDATIAASLPNGYVYFPQADCLGEPVWNAPFPGETFVYFSDRDDLFHVFAISHTFIGRTDGVSFLNLSGSCVNSAVSLDNVYRSTELILPYLRPNLGAVLFAPLSVR